MQGRSWSGLNQNLMYVNMKTRVDYFRVVAWTLAFAMSISIWIVVIDRVRPLFVP